MPDTLASIILPVYNSGKFIERTLQSIYSQTFKDFELIIVDDGSSDNTLEIIENFKDKLNIVLIIGEHTADVGKNRNKALVASKGEFIYFIDSDDLWEPVKMEYYQKLFRNGHDFICSNAKIIDENDRVIKKSFFTNIDFDFNIKLSDLVKLNFVITSSLAIRKKVINGLRFYEEPGFIVEDYIFWLKIIERNPGVFIDKSLVSYRVHSTNFSLGAPEKRIKVLTRTISIRKSYFNYNDSEVRKKAKEGCDPLYKELIKIYLKQKNYITAYDYAQNLSFNIRSMHLKGIFIYGLIYIVLSLINAWRKLKN